VALNDPTPILHQNMMIFMDKMSKDKKMPVQEKAGLLGPKKSMIKTNDDISVEDSKIRVASYMEQIQTKREEVKNG
jgi:hypothetical protein